MASSTKKAANESAIDEALERLPDGGRPLRAVHDASTEEMLELAEQLVERARTSLASDDTERGADFKVRVESVERLFLEYAGESPEFAEALDEALRELRHVEEIAKLDLVWDTTCAQALNKFDLVSVQNAAKVQNAEDNWRLAVRVFEAARRSSGAILHAEIEKAAEQLRPAHREGQRDGFREVDHYGRSITISKALVAYQQSIATATSSLAKAVGTLITQLADASTATAVGEAQLIDATQNASKKFWTAVQNELTSRS